MKTETALILLSIALLFYGAYYFSDKEAPEPEPPIENKLTGPCEDTIFLGYHFGMTEQEFETHSLQLINEGDVTKNGNLWQTTLKANESSDPFTARYIGFFDQNSLYEIIIAVESNERFMSTTLVALQLVTLYMGRYRGFDEAPNPYGVMYTSNQGCYQVSIGEGPSDAKIIYTDLYRQQVVDSLDHIQDSILLEDTKGKI